MLTCPSPDDLVAAVIAALAEEVMPALRDEKAAAAAGMAIALLTEARQMLPDYERYLVEEHNDMAAVFREVGRIAGEGAGPAAVAIRGRAQELGAQPDLPRPLDPAALAEAHRRGSEGLADTFRDLDALEDRGAAERAAAAVRAHLGPRLARDAAVLTGSAHMVGRG